MADVLPRRVPDRLAREHGGLEYNAIVSRDGPTLYFGCGGRIWFIVPTALGVPALTANRFR